MQILKLKFELAREEKMKCCAEKEKVALELQLVKEKGLSALSNNYSGLLIMMSDITFRKCLNSSSDVLEFFALFERTCIFNGIDENKMANLLRGVLNANEHKIYARLSVEQCRHYGVVRKRS